jgi:hypothetical protein
MPRRVRSRNARALLPALAKNAKDGAPPELALPGEAWATRPV